MAVVLLASAGVRLWDLARPADYMFDEIYYAKDAKAIVDGRVGPKPGPYPWEAGDEVSWPHPELGKMLIAAGIVLFGDRAFGWRLPSVVAGMVLLACVYPLARRLGLSPPWALLALVLAAADPLGMAQSRIATLDIFVAVWTVLCIYFALRYAQDGRRPVWLLATGAAGGVALATKWSGALALVAAALILLVGWLWSRRAGARAAAAARVSDAAGAGAWAAADPLAPVAAAALPEARANGDAQTAADDDDPSVLVRERGALASLGLVLVALVAVPALIYLLSYTQYFLSGHTWAQWRELQRQMYVFNLHLHATHTYASAAPTWIVDYRPVWYYFKTINGLYRGIVAIGNPFLWWAATAALFAAPLLAILRRSWLAVAPAALVAVLYLPWFASSRTSFLYYMTPVAPFMAILVAAVLFQMAGGVRLPQWAWMAGVAAGLVTAVVWDPISRHFASRQHLTSQPRYTPTGNPEHAVVVMFQQAFHALGWSGLIAGFIGAAAVIGILTVPRLQPVRPWLAMVLAGAIAGIVVAFIPVVLAMPITPAHFSHITWFPSWV